MALFDSINKHSNPDGTSIVNYLKSKEKDEKLGPELIKLLYTNLLDFAIPEKTLANYNHLANLLLLETLQTKRIFLGDLPLNRYKLLIAKHIELDKMKEIIKNTINSIQQYGFHRDLFNVFFMLYGEIAQLPRDIHLYRNLQWIRGLWPNDELAIFVEMTHLATFNRYHGLMAGRPVEDEKALITDINEAFIEKLAILEVLCESRGETRMSDGLKLFMQGKEVLFDEMVKKYEAMKKEILK